MNVRASNRSQIRVAVIQGLTLEMTSIIEDRQEADEELIVHLALGFSATLHCRVAL